MDDPTSSAGTPKWSKNAVFSPGCGSNEPLGAFVTDGKLIRSPSSTHHQLSLTADGTLTDQTFAWKGRLVTTDLQQDVFDGVNVARPAGKIVLYTPAFGPTTMTATPRCRSRPADDRAGR